MPTPPLRPDDLVQSFLRAADEHTVSAVVIYAYQDGPRAVSKLKSNRPPTPTQAMLVSVVGELAKIATDNMEAMRAMLLKLERDSEGRCPLCSGDVVPGEHYSNCELAALLARIKMN